MPQVHNNELALLHVLGTPDSADTWVPFTSLPEAARVVHAMPGPPQGGWHLPVAWLTGSAAARELLNEVDFELLLPAAVSVRGIKRPAPPPMSEEEAASKRARMEVQSPGISRGEAHTIDTKALSAGDGAASGPATGQTPAPGLRVENISHGQAQAGTPTARVPPPAVAAASPAPGAPSAVPPQTAGLSLPAYASWFKYDAISEVERRGLPEFFSPAGAAVGRTTGTYRTLRNALVNKFREDPSRKITFTECRSVLGGDVNALLRVFNFLEHWGLINYTQNPVAAHPQARAPPATTAAIAAAPEADAVPAALQLSARAGGPPPQHALFEFDPHRSGVLPSSAAAGAAALAARAVPAWLRTYNCNACGCDLTVAPRYHCLRLPDYDLCATHYADGRFVPGVASSDFVLMDGSGGATAPPGLPSTGVWSDAETLLLLEALELHGDKWDDIARHVGTKSKPQCLAHFLALPIEDKFLDEMEGKPAPLPPGIEPGPRLLPFEDAGNPVMAQVAFLSAVVGPRVAAAAAAAALAALEIEYGTAGEAQEAAGAAAAAAAAAAIPTSAPLDPSAPPTAEAVRRSAAVCLAGAAVKAKLLADQEERDIHRLVVSALDSQLRKVELKMKQLEELDDVLRKETEAADAARAVLAADKAAVAAYRLVAQQAQAAQAAANTAAAAAAAAAGGVGLPPQQAGAGAGAGVPVAPPQPPKVETEPQAPLSAVPETTQQAAGEQAAPEAQPEAMVTE